MLILTCLFKSRKSTLGRHLMISRISQPRTMQNHPKAALAEALGILSRAKRPFIFCGRGGRSEAEWNNRIKLAERLNARTATHMKLPAGFPTTHPLFIGETGWRLKGAVLEAIQSADAILMLDWLDGGNALKLAFPAGVSRPPVINVSNDFHIAPRVEHGLWRVASCRCVDTNGNEHYGCCAA